MASDDPTPSSELEQLAGQVRRMRYDFRDPERFYEARSEIAGALMRISRALVGRPMSVPAPMPIRRAIAAALPHRPRVTAPPPVPRVVVAPPPPPPRVARAGPLPRLLRCRRHRFPLPPPSVPTQARLL